MAEDQASAPALKEIFNRERFRNIAGEAEAVSPAFDRKRFLAVATKDLDDLSIMQRLRQGAEALHAALPLPYEQVLPVLNELAPRIGHNFASMILPEYVALYGRDHFDLSMQALAFFTRFGSSEFAVRHFLLDDQERALGVMRGWAKDQNEHVRRLASEGSRPRLPWSFQLKALIDDPSPALPILQTLRADSSLYVRKSVANHLNDIGKDHPGLLLETLSGWDRGNERTAWIAKHALRTLIKKGDANALALVGASGAAEVRIDGFAVTPGAVTLGAHVAIIGEIVSTSKKDQRLVADYAVYYVKKNGAPSRKVFKLKEFDLPAGARQPLSIKRAIRDFTTRKHYPGHHRVELMVNGKVLAEGGFDLEG
ncbi:MAG: DNA alkylation repair protein [Rhizobiaceae bacterium]|nr:DNA alkylation repair protein [Rhizobiaceae bacterium]